MKVNIHEAKTHLSRLVDRAAAGEEIVIGRAGKPVAQLVAYRPKVGRREPGLWRGQVTIRPSFDELDAVITAEFDGSE